MMSSLQRARADRKPAAHAGRTPIPGATSSGLSSSDAPPVPPADDGAIATLQARANAGSSPAARMGARLQASPAVQRIARTHAMLNARTPRPAQAAGGAAPIQRKIDYTSTSVKFGDVRDRAGLIARAQVLFPLLPNVAELVDDIEGQRGSWSLGQVYAALSARSAAIPVPLASGERDASILLPSNPKHRRDFGFTTRTRARGRVDRDGGEPLPLRESTQVSKTFHAEDDVMEQLDKLLAKGEIDPGDTIHITINNSPCGARCAPNLARWFQANWTGRMIIRYANPHGKLDEFIQAREVLQAAGIEVESFPAERHVDGLSSKQQAKFRGMKLRRKTYRAEWNRTHEDDQSSDSDAEPDVSRGRRRSRSRSRDRRSASPVPKAHRVERERRDVTVGERPYWLDPDETANDGDCFYTTIIAMGLAGGRDVAGLRELALANGARAAAGNAGEWANMADIAAVARGLGIQIEVAAFDNHYQANQINAPVGDGGPIHSIAQIFGGHFVPLHPA